MIYGGSIQPGYSETLKKPINISTTYESFGAYVYKTLKSAEEGKFTPDEIMEDIEKNACPGAGACGGMYTANTMSTSLEGMRSPPIQYYIRARVLMNGSHGTDSPELINHTSRESRKNARVHESCTGHQDLHGEEHHTEEAPHEGVF